MKLVWFQLASDKRRDLRHASVEHWGRDVALRCLEDIRDAAHGVAANPQAARPLRGKLRILRVRSHDLIVPIDEDAGRLTVARILHTATDIERHLP